MKNAVKVNACFLAKIRFDTAENEPAKNLQNFANFADSLRGGDHGLERRRGAAPAGVRPAAGGGRVDGRGRGLDDLRYVRVRVSKISKIGKFLQNFVNFWRARSRLYQNEIFQENMRLTAFATLYKICILVHRCNLKIFAKNRFEKSAMLIF